jgi:hypothetical protein
MLAQSINLCSNVRERRRGKCSVVVLAEAVIDYRRSNNVSELA